MEFTNQLNMTELAPMGVNVAPAGMASIPKDKLSPSSSSADNVKLKVSPSVIVTSVMFSRNVGLLFSTKITFAIYQE